jgi:hypothetical protein
MTAQRSATRVLGVSAGSNSMIAMRIDWQSIGNASTAIGVFIALAGVVVTLIMTLRSETLTRAGQQLQREQADAAAARSEAAASLTEEYTRRVVEALETIATRGATGAASTPIEPRVRWTLEHHQGDTYILTNVGNRQAREVGLTSHASLRLVNVPPPQTVGPDEALTFMAAKSMATRDSTIVVRWLEGDSDEERIWKYPLPARPPRR